MGIGREVLGGGNLPGEFGLVHVGRDRSARGVQLGDLDQVVRIRTRVDSGVLGPRQGCRCRADINEGRGRYLGLGGVGLGASTACPEGAASGLGELLGGAGEAVCASL